MQFSRAFNVTFVYHKSMLNISGPPLLEKKTENFDEGKVEGIEGKNSESTLKKERHDVYAPSLKVFARI